jgi:hypothetical protein
VRSLSGAFDGCVVEWLRVGLWRMGVLGLRCGVRVLRGFSFLGFRVGKWDFLNFEVRKSETWFLAVFGLVAGV